MLHTTVKLFVNAFTCSYEWIQRFINNVVRKLTVHGRVDTYIGEKVDQIAFMVKLHTPLPTKTKTKVIVATTQNNQNVEVRYNKPRRLWH